MGNSYPRIAPSAREQFAQVSSPSYSHRFVYAQREEAVLAEDVFDAMLTLERRCAQRSRKPFVLMLLDANLENGEAAGILRQAIDVVWQPKERPIW